MDGSQGNDSRFTTNVGQQLAAELTTALARHRFTGVPLHAASPSGIVAVLKRQTFNTNRAVAIVAPNTMPADFGAYVLAVRDEVAPLCKYIPFFWGIGIQVVAIINGSSTAGIDPQKHVALVDNQWAIVQSIFLIDPARNEYREGRTWGQVITGKFQDAIAAVLGQRYQRL